MIRRVLTVTLAAALLAAAPSALAAEPAPAQQMNTRLGGPGAGANVYFIYDWGGYGVGGRYEQSLLPNGLLKGSSPSIKKDTIDIDIGLDFVHHSWSYWYTSNFDASYNILRPAVGASWKLWLNDQLCVYPKIELGFDISWWSTSNWPGGYTPPSHTGIFANGAAGALYKFSKSLAAKGELGVSGVRLGVAYEF